MCATTFSLLRTRMISTGGTLHRLLHTSTHNSLITYTENTTRNSFHGCTLHAARMSSYCTRPHPSIVPTTSHHLHTHPLDIPTCLLYQRLLVNTYYTSDLYRQWARDNVHESSTDVWLKYLYAKGLPALTFCTPAVHQTCASTPRPVWSLCSRQTSPNLTMQHWCKVNHKILDDLDVDQDL
jgi:hypothetical protein